jgi:cell fate regulator YaaT (PSP1 superfamily)
MVVRTERGVELGEVIILLSDPPGERGLHPDRLRDFIRANGVEYPFRRDGKILRPANHQDVVDFRHLETAALEEATYCRQQIRDLKLPMKLVTVEHLLGGDRIIFYFAAESRVDFRELVRKLAGEYRTRIEMRQVGARDEARLVADYERCGRRCCCQQFLKDLKPVSMRMAKTQKATLDPTKISGRCGRLMCCLRYEDATYEELRKRLPRRNTWVRTADCIGKVLDGQILTQLVRLGLMDGNTQSVGVEEIIERDVPQPERRQAPPPRRVQRERPRPRRRLAETITDQAQAPTPQSAATPAQTDGAKAPSPVEAPKKRRRRRRKKRPASGTQEALATQTASQAPGASDGQPPSAAPSETSQGTLESTDGAPRKKRRRRRRKKKPT